MNVFRETKSILGESLVWSPESHSMLWCDITAGLVHRSEIGGAADGSDDTTIALPAPVASFHFAVGGGFVVSLGDRVVLADSAGTVTRTLAHIKHAHAGLRLNEGKVDHRGRWVTGSMDVTTKDPDGAFYCVTPDGDLRMLIGGIGVANGLEWSPDGSRIWFTDTSVETIYTGAYAPDGQITHVEPWHQGVPHDGLTMAADGTFWGAQYGTGKVVHYTADARELETIDLPAPNLTSVALDGDGTLYVCSARENLTEEQLEQYPLSGSVFSLATATRGIPASTFG